MALAIVLILLVVGSVLFHLLSPWYLTTIASNWETIDTTIDITFWVTGFVFVAVNLFMAYVIIRYRHQKGRKADYEPENKKLEVWLTGLTAVGVAAMLAPGLFVWGKFVVVPDDAHTVEVVGQQWHWSYRFPGADGKFGTVDPRNIGIDNPFGMNPDDPQGRDDVLVSSPQLHLPIDRPVKVLLRSKDVLHDFAVPQFRVKMDLVPGMVTYLWLTPTREGRFEILCEELCGMAHHTMRGTVTVESEDSFRAWLASHPTYAETLAQTGGDPALGERQYAVCVACHGAQGEGNRDLNSPRLAGLDGWYIARQLEYFRTGVRGAHEDDVYGKQMAPMAATLPDDEAVANVVAYIDTFPVEPAPVTVVGDVARGERLYETCVSCHGPQAEGIWAMNAPWQAGMDDWYLARQLENFKRGIRGAHPDDLYGAQMAAMARVLRDSESVNDVVAYIASLQQREPARQASAAPGESRDERGRGGSSGEDSRQSR